MLSNYQSINNESYLNEINVLTYGYEGYDMSFSSFNLRFAVMKVESVAGTPIWNMSSTFPADADFNNRIYGIEPSLNIDFDEDVANIATGDHAELSGLSGKQSGQISFTFPMHWGGAVATAPNWSKIAQACGLYEHAYTTTGIGYQPLKQMDNITYTIAVFDMDLGGASPNSTCYLFAGCKGNMVISAENNGKLMAACTFKGKLVDVLAVANANIPEPTGMQATLAEKLLNSTFTINTVTQWISGFSLDLGNDVQPVINQSQTTGYDYFYIASRKPRFSCNPLQIAVGADDVLDRMISDTSGVISLATTNLTLYIPRAQLMSMALANREGLVNWDQSYICQRNHNGLSAIQAAIPNECTFELYQGARA